MKTREEIAKEIQNIVKNSDCADSYYDVADWHIEQIKKAKESIGKKIEDYVKEKIRINAQFNPNELIRDVKEIIKENS